MEETHLLDTLDKTTHMAFPPSLEPPAFPVSSTAETTMRHGPQDNVLTILALMTFGGFFLVLVALIFVEVPASAASALSIMLGALTAGVSTVLSFYFGSSAGSARKTELLTTKPKEGP